MGHDGRYAPSPTGPLHLGNLRTALVAWLMARHAGARLLLRIDDLDAGRSRPEHEAGQLADLAALGLDFDGDPVRASARADRHAEAIATLAAAGLTYPCFCTRAEIREASSAAHGDGPESAYPGTCRDLSAAERTRRARDGRPPALRVRADAALVAFDDLVAGRQEGVVDDVVVRRNDGAPAYNLAVVVDDHDQGVGEVVRGADLLPSTPRQLWLHAALGLGAPPRHAHVGLLLGADGTRLAKRHGAITLAEATWDGTAPEEVRGRLAASIGLAAPGEAPGLPALLERFDPATLSAAPTLLG